MNLSPSISALMFGTLIAAVVIAAIFLVRFLRKPANRHPMEGERERNIDEIRANVAPGNKPPAE